MDPLVSVAWLAAHLHDPQIAVLDATLPPVGVTLAPDVHGRYRQQHIPGAVFFDIEAFSDHSTSLPHMLPGPDDFAAGVGALGLTESMTLVVYEQQGVFSAPRAWWMLRTMGAANVFVLQGGLPAWVAGGHATEAGDVMRPRTTFRANLRADAVRDFAQVQAILAQTPPAEQLLDARAVSRFAGTAPEPRAGLPSGHMPGAINIPFPELVANGALKEVSELKQVFAKHGVDLQRPITTTCGSGVTAAVLALGLELCGARQVRLYDGSWAEYAQTPEAVLETSRG